VCAAPSVFEQRTADSNGGAVVAELVKGANTKAAVGICGRAKNDI
jgi:hypothetical protein